MYIRMKSRACTEVGIEFEHVKLPTSIKESDLITTINRLNNNDSVHGILLQLPITSDHPIGAYNLQCT